MNRRDEELLDRQLHNMHPARNDGLLGVTVAMVFLIGFVLGGLLFAHPHAGTPSTLHGELAAITPQDSGTTAIR
jgi:hypothetical protein